LRRGKRRLENRVSWRLFLGGRVHTIRQGWLKNYVVSLKSIPFRTRGVKGGWGDGDIEWGDSFEKSGGGWGGGEREEAVSGHSSTYKITKSRKKEVRESKFSEKLVNQESSNLFG